MAAHLAGVIAAHTHKPVLGIPLGGGDMNGLDSLMSTVQMPKGIPVATFAIGKSGAINAALCAVQILSLADTNLSKKFDQFRKDQTEEVIQINSETN
jgi:5-(carboxyamino)imidazole ribonucleotide mutase